MLPSDAVRVKPAKRNLPPDAVRVNQTQPDIQQRSAQYGSITKTPTAFERVTRNLTSPATRPLSMPDNPILSAPKMALSAAGIPEEDVYPAVGQFAGGMAKGFPLAGLVGSVLGTGIGDVAKQGVKGVRGQKPDYSEVPKNMALTGLIESVTRGAGKIFFRKQLANEALDALSSKLISMKERIANNPHLKSASKPILDHIKVAYDSLPEPMQSGKTASRLRSWMKHLEKNTEISSRDLIMMEEDLGKASTYGEVKKGVFMPAVDIPNAATNKIAKTSRTKVSGIVDQLAEQGGEKGFKKTSLKLSKAISKSKDYDPSKSYGSFAGRMGTAIGTTALTGNPMVGVGAYALEKALQNPSVRNKLFELARNKTVSTVGTGTKLGLSELVRRKS